MVFISCQEEKIDVKGEQLSHKTSDYNITIDHSLFSSTDENLNKSCQIYIYGGYTIDKKRTVVLPTTATQYYIGTGFSYNINKKLQLKTGIEYQYNIIYKRWEWVWNSGIRFSF